MNDFYAEVSEKKKVASGARHKVSGGRSKSCHLPVDDMTPKQLKSLHGAVVTYHLGKPMKWAEFKAMPQDLQKKYIERLICTYGVTNTKLASMFGVASRTVTRCLVDLGIHRRRGCHERMTAEQTEAWEKFEVGE